MAVAIPSRELLAGLYALARSTVRVRLPPRQPCAPNFHAGGSRCKDCRENGNIPMNPAVTRAVDDSATSDRSLQGSAEDLIPFLTEKST